MVQNLFSITFFDSTLEFLFCFKGVCVACPPLISTYRNNGWILLKLLGVDNIWNIYGKMGIKIMKNFFFVFSVFNHFKTNATSVVFGSMPLIIKINTLFVKIFFSKL